MEQRSREWFDDRRGKITASEVDCVKNGWLVRGKNKGERSADAMRYMIELAGERITGKDSEYFVTKAMRDGTKREPEAIINYEFEKGVDVTPCGFFNHPVMSFSGASPDGLVGEDGGIEVKCPVLNTFLTWKLNGTVPEEHLAQIHWGMACTGRKWWDFVAYHPDMPHGLNLMIVRVDRDEELIKQYESAVMEFELELQEMVKKIKGSC